MTQHGLGGMKGGKSYQRRVEDKSYYVGALRQKINELASETGRLTKETKTFKDDSSGLTSLQRAAEALANELKDLRVFYLFLSDSLMDSLIYL